MFNNTIIIIFVALGLLFAGLGVPLVRRKIGINSVYGFRTEKTMKDDKTWYSANAILGRNLIIAGIAQVVSAVVIGRYLSAADPFKFSMVNVGSLVVLLAIAIIHAAIRTAKI